jgi:dolichol-phosphate mannosyltransferase
VIDVRAQWIDEVVICVIPTLNEDETIEHVVRHARKYADRVIVVDGCSEDETWRKAKRAGAEVVLQIGEGKGMALRTIFQQIKGDIYVIIDGDATYDALEMRKLLLPILEDEADMVVGSRLLGDLETGAISRVNQLGNHLFNTLINLVFRGGITDSQSGFRAIHRTAIDKLTLVSEGFEIETELTVKALKHGLRVREVPIRYLKRRGSPSKLNSFKAGTQILKTIFKNMKRDPYLASDARYRDTR